MATDYLYMPISGTTLAKVLQSSEGVLSQLPTDELIGLYALSYLPKCPPDTINATIEKVISELFSNIEQNSADLRATILDNLNLEDVRAGAKLMNQFKLRPVNADSVEKRSYLRAGQWDFNFRSTYSEDLHPATHYGIDNLVTSDQLKALSIIRSGLEEPIHFEAYAGSGKSFLVARVPEVVQSMGIRPEEILVLAPLQNQLKALPQHFLKNYTCRTYATLASNMVPKHMKHMSSWSPRNQPFPSGRVIEHLGIKAIGRYSPDALLAAAIESVRKYCSSSNDLINSDHLPKWIVEGRFDDAAQRDRILHYVVGIAQNIWNILLHPAHGIHIPIRSYHQLKLVALSGEVINQGFRLVLMDETHNLDPVMAQILDRSPQFVISFGDRFQALRKPVLVNSARQVQLTSSFRSPVLFEPAINHVLSKHRYPKDGKFNGNHQLPAEISYFDHESIPQAPCTIYVSDFWSLWAWIYRLAEASISFRMITSGPDITQFVHEVLLLRNFKKMPVHRHIRKYGSYDQLMKDFADNASFVFVQDLIDHGYEQKNWDADCKNYMKDSGTYAVGLAADGSNMEHDRIMLTSDAANLLWNDRKDIDYDRFSAIYIALTRAKYQLFLPKIMHDFLSSSTT